MEIYNEQILRGDILKVTEKNFEATAIKLFNFQYQNNYTYRSYCNLLGTKPTMVLSINEIPFLPIQFFKTKKVQTTTFIPEIIFESSGTTGAINSKHFVKELSLYRESFEATFQQFYGDVKQYCILGLLPSYLEKKGSSLVYMVDTLIKKSNNPNSGFYLYNVDELKNILLENEANKTHSILIGVTYALIDFAAQNNMQLQHTTIMETGGMKGRKAELARNRVHEILTTQLGVLKVHSEYGMTELLSQAYSKGDGIFTCPPHMQILLRSQDDPLEIITETNNNANCKIGAVNIIDLANMYSCAFIATDDVGKLYPDKSFEILGRMENSDVRGCGLMII